MIPRFRVHIAGHRRVVMAGVRHRVYHAYDLKIWEQIWELNSAKLAQISAAARTKWDT